MPWVVGIDEAGYGPNLGPLVQAAVGLRLPDADPAGWDTLRPWVRRTHERADGRLLIDDSKKVYAGPNGFALLERAALCGLSSDQRPAAVGQLFDRLHPRLRKDLEAEGWLDIGQSLPVDSRPADDTDWHFAAVLDRCEAGFHCRPVVVTARPFNHRVDEAGSKAVVLADGLIHLLQDVITLDGDSILVVCDKQGGRNFYGPLLQAAFSDGWIVPERESAAESRYRVVGLGREVTVVFRPKADGDSVCVALASMVCKYLREVCMLQFNAFWQKHVPGLKPTAGYPGDAKRFYAEIQPAMAKLGLPPDSVWRKK